MRIYTLNLLKDVTQRFAINPTRAACEALTDIGYSICLQDRVHRIGSVEQLRELWEIDADAYEECSLPFAVFRSWWENYEPGLTAISRNDKIIGCMGIFPLSKDQYEGFVSGNLAEAELVPVPLEICEEFPQHYWYFSGIVIDPTIRGTKAAPLKLLLSMSLGQWYSSGHVGYPVNNCAMGYSREGELILGRFTFCKLVDGANYPDCCPIYEMLKSTNKDMLQVIKARGL
jgi:hypothetical protein